MNGLIKRLKFLLIRSCTFLRACEPLKILRFHYSRQLVDERNESYTRCTITTLRKIVCISYPNDFYKVRLTQLLALASSISIHVTPIAIRSNLKTYIGTVENKKGTDPSSFFLFFIFRVIHFSQTCNVYLRFLTRRFFEQLNKILMQYLKFLKLDVSLFISMRNMAQKIATKCFWAHAAFGKSFAKIFKAKVSRSM